MKPLTIVISSYNNRHWYEQNLGSLCAQPYDNFRAIYVDGGSSDQTGEFVEQFIADHGVGHRIQLIRNPALQPQVVPFTNRTRLTFDGVLPLWGPRGPRPAPPVRVHNGRLSARERQRS